MEYKWYILPIGVLYGTYHLLREPGFTPLIQGPEVMPQPILAQPPTPVARGSVGRASGLAPRKRPWPMPQILGTVAKATPARPQVPIVSQAVQIQPANIGIPASRWKTQAQEWLLGEELRFSIFFLVAGIVRLNKTGGLGWWFGVGGKAFFLYVFSHFFKSSYHNFKTQKV